MGSRADGGVLPWVVVVWGMGVAGMSLWQVSGWLVLQRIRGMGRPVVEVGVVEVFERMKRRLGVRRVVGLLESMVVKTPMVVGWMRPVILLPVSLASGLSAGQLEAILAHELAHVRRWDCLVRMIQAAAETVLFYHPAVWWLSGRVTQESGELLR